MIPYEHLAAAAVTVY